MPSEPRAELVEREAERLWYEREARFPAFTRRPYPKGAVSYLDAMARAYMRHRARAALAERAEERL